MEKPILVLKIGTASITKENGDLDQITMVDIVRQLASIHKKYRIVIVSSGAVGTGKNLLKNYSGKIIERKAAAAIGNPLLLNRYAQFFAPYDIAIAQSLCERQHFSNLTQFNQLKQTFQELWANEIIPIANENDVVSNLELKFSDNDELATLIAVGFGASNLLLGTSVPGLVDKDNNIIRRIKKIDESVLSLAHKEQSAMGLGGMVSKLTFARLATRMGIKTTIFGIRSESGIIKALEDKVGTLFDAQKDIDPETRTAWLSSGNLVTGKLQIEKKGVNDLLKGNSLKAISVIKIIENFEKGEIFEIQNGHGSSLAVARAIISSKEIIEKIKDTRFEIATSQDIVML
ncbi:glutamate 5-kinase [Fulvivirgaceae bacterium BMA12]|uniref:Glutamate 5-kinase n=1 Tax=Agaribacillus aureus TaxID=3051825 RepID=A0ABT8KZU8_9BACT|nr:glutamate 5-kinase [Fulvivirgaceae bacterium BMA12]